MPHWWWPTGQWVGKDWVGPAQVEDKSPENIRRCYAFLRSRPYLTQEDRAQLEMDEWVSVTEAQMMGRDDG